MYMVINISLHLVIGTWIKINNFIMKRIVWLFIDKKTHLLIAMDFWNQKIWTGCLTGSQNEKNYIDSHSKFVIGTQYMMKYKMLTHIRKFFFQTLNHLIVKDFWMVKIWPYFHKSIWVTSFVCFSNFLSQKICFWKFYIGHYSYRFCGFSF
jgi:hypothetical protein